MSQLPTICFLTGTMNAFAGAERMTAVIANALSQRGYRVHILSLADSHSCFALHPKLSHHAIFESRPSFKRHYLTAVGRIRRYVTEHDVDVLVEVDPMLTWFTLPALAGTSVNRVAWEHCHFGEDLGNPARRVARWLAAHTAAGIVVLTVADQALWQAAIRHRFDVRVIANPLPFDLPRELAPRHTQVVLAVGRLVPAKGFDVLLKAWRQVSHDAPGWRLEIVGDGPEREALELLATQLDITNTVSMPGARQDIEAAYLDASIFCMSSRYEGFGLVLLEAMSHGLPVVATACDTGPRSLIEDGVNALAVAVDTPDALAEGLLRVIGNPALQRALSQGGRSTAQAHSVDRIIGQWERLFEDVRTKR